MILIWTRPSTTNLKIYNFGKPFVGNPNYILSVSDLCLAVGENNAFSIYDLYFHAIAQHKPQGDYEIYILG